MRELEISADFRLVKSWYPSELTDKPNALTAHNKLFPLIEMSHSFYWEIERNAAL